MATMYAWTRFRTKVDKWGKVIESVEVGDEVTREKLKVEGWKWDELVERGLVRPEKYPDIPSHMSPAEYAAKLKAAKQRGEDEPTSTQVELDPRIEDATVKKLAQKTDSTKK